MKYYKWSLLAIVMLMVGCSTPYNAVSKTAKVLWDPSIPVGYPEDLPSRVALTMLAEPDVNPNESLAPTPIAYQIIELRDSSLLMAGDFDQLLNNLKDSLGRNYVDHSDYTLVPGQFKYVEPFEISKDTRFIGVIAFYAYPNLSQWKKVVKVDPIGDTYHLLINLREREVQLRRSEDT
ncbi:type VI secretion system lipoprotein TssJ [Marinobacter halophilus]|uniref:Type VI secretion system lipoprotein TssJ n=1 Tax=Marinobacter halophilus TaxID=1323740 RepID=A0A2T1KHL8_9GAMM|nr:type VI secretion system lipoprotein TssJ [Marinobacter halophilus]PSF09656.1 type VI secretion system lipoprotein TssJ [Marinobacter halophilus]GGC65261.1 type VI secretion system-associated lipoprotein [Marinobacter halophilus]